MKKRIVDVRATQVSSPACEHRVAERRPHGIADCRLYGVLSVTKLSGNKFNIINLVPYFNKL